MTIVTWMGTPVSELSHDELVAIVSELHTEVEDLRTRLLRSQIDHITDIARMHRRPPS